MLLPPEQPFDIPDRLAGRPPRRDTAAPARARWPRRFRGGMLLAGAPLALWLLTGWAPREPAPATAATAEPVRAAAPADAGRADEIVIAGNEIDIAEAASLGVEDGAVTRREATLGRGGTLDAALARLQIDERLRAGVIEALGQRLDLQRLPEAAGLVAVMDASGALCSLAVRTAPDSFVRVRPGRLAGDAATAETVELVPATLVETAGGTVSRSVAQALAEHGSGHELALAAADLFQWDVDLLVDPRPGDRVRVVYEVRRLAEAPPDLPAFGNAARRAGDELGLGRILAASYVGAVARSTAFWVDEGDGAGRYYDEQGRPLQKTFLKSPLNYRRISSRFSRARRHPVTRKVVPHHGVDFAAPTGTPVVAAADGRVVRAGWKGALGRSIRLRHGGEYASVYGHLSRIAEGIRPGIEVRQNQVIGYVGSTGRATGPHLHYALIERGQPIDPLGMRNPPANPTERAQPALLRRAKATWSPLLGSIPLESELADSRARGKGPSPSA